MDDKPKRRWFRFSLRTMFVACTVVAVWLGLVSHKVRERRLAAQNTRLYSAEENGEDDRRSYHHPSIPWYRKLMGDRVYRWVQVNDSASDDELANAERLFPEAVVMRNPRR